MRRTAPSGDHLVVMITVQLSDVLAALRQTATPIMLVALGVFAFYAVDARICARGRRL